MNERLSGRSAIVVGASSGMGRETARLLAEAGMNVMLAARREERLRELQAELAGGPGTVDYCTTDSSQAGDVERLIAATVEKFGGVHLLVYATGANLPERALEVLTPESWEMMLATNLTGAFLCTRAVLPVMRAAGDGHLIYLSSAAVQMPDVSGVAYQASKHGLSGLAFGTRVEEKRHGIRTTVIYPGLCDTEILAKRPVPTPREILEQALDPRDVAEAVVFAAQLPPRAVVTEMQVLPSRL